MIGCSVYFLFMGFVAINGTIVFKGIWLHDVSEEFLIQCENALNTIFLREIYHIHFILMHVCVIASSACVINILYSRSLYFITDWP